LNATKKVTKKERFTFSVNLLSSNKPTVDKHIYTPEILEHICEHLSKSPPIIIQEMNEVERKVKKVPIQLPWMQQIMADVLNAEIIKGNLIVHALCRQNREGRKLEGIIKSIGMENLVFFPVGYGEVDKNNVIKPNYQLNYIAVEPKKK
jgi:hypothetical protein